MSTRINKFRQSFVKHAFNLHLFEGDLLKIRCISRYAKRLLSFAIKGIVDSRLVTIGPMNIFIRFSFSVIDRFFIPGKSVCELSSLWF